MHIPNPVSVTQYAFNKYLLLRGQIKCNSTIFGIHAGFPTLPIGDTELSRTPITRPPLILSSLTAFT